MKTGLALIIEERVKQLDSGKTPQYDYEKNTNSELGFLASVLSLNYGIDNHFYITLCPPTWDKDKWKELLDKPYRDRLPIAGALIAAEIDRLLLIEEKNSTGS